MWHLYLDESGDLSFDFEQKNPSDHLTVCVLAAQSFAATRAIKCAVTKTLRRKVNRRKLHKQELKGADTAFSVKQYFYRLLLHCPFKVYSITIRKRDIRRYLEQGRITKSGFYDEVADFLLASIPLDGVEDGIELVVDKSKNQREIAEFNRVIGERLRRRVSRRARVTITHQLSCVDLGLSAADLFCWGIFRRYESGDSEWYEEYLARVEADEVYP
jgi:hypothetical protein